MGLRSLRGVIPKLGKKVKLEHCENFTLSPSLRLAAGLSLLAPTSNSVLCLLSPASMPRKCFTQ